MNFTGILRTALAVAIAAIMPMVAGTTTQTTAQSTEVNILFPALYEMNLDYLEGRVVSADTSATAIEVDCRSAEASQCSSSGYVLPVTPTTGATFQDYHYDITSLEPHYLHRYWDFGLQCDLVYAGRLLLRLDEHVDN
ncbi:uncharacterized protein N7482_003118 [Penicillium canariense]|uniref:Uncharacterized protein n=1 Tax=Penicillium canariense TaxID=189055 RepID=A0A9W9IKA1_9EURO|nr:uncharacterized protein N7482_003118 [Penicillium canariense]KAJ5177241.1 hypothetical protein N7482_003118 [Penicillium canariense]